MNRKVQSFILSGNKIFVGLEVSKRTWVLCVRSSGTIVHETSMPADCSGLKGYLDNKFPQCTVNVIYEAGFCGFTLHDQLTADGFTCVVTPPHTVTIEKHRPIKNDRVDSRRLAKILETNDYRKCFVHDAQQRDDRMLCRRIQQVQQEIVREKNRLRRDLEFCGMDPFPEKAVWTDRMYREIINDLRPLGASQGVIEAIESILRIVKHLRDEKLLLLKRLRALAKTERYAKTVRIYQSTPGIGLLTAMRFALEWGDLSRFKTKARFAHFLGLCPGEHSSGETDHKGHITKQGNQQVRMHLIESAWILIRYDPVMAMTYARLKKQTGSGKKAITAVARKLAIRLRAMYQTQTEYVIGIVE